MTSISTMHSMSPTFVGLGVVGWSATGHFRPFFANLRKVGGARRDKIAMG